MPRLPRTVYALGAVSLLTDLSSEMIYPLLPVFLTTVLGAGAVSLGLIEGVAESVAAAVKLAAGRWSDRTRGRRGFVLAGYGLSGLARPVIGVAAGWPAVLLLRFLDRIGKGVRGAPRDALIADVVSPAERGRAFGVHRAMDHAGAVLGPLAAAALLGLGLGLREVFVASLVPAIVVMAVILGFVREPRPASAAPPADVRSPTAAGPGFTRLMVALVLFGLGASTDAFLLLALTTAGVPAAGVALLWALHHVVKMTATAIGGRLSDRRGRKPLLLAGWALYAAVYVGFATAPSAGWVIAWFLVYGLSFGCTEPVEKALVADLASAGRRGGAFGVYHAVVAATALPASLLFGALWTAVSPAAAFATGAGLAAVAAIVLAGVPEPQARV